MTSGRSLHRITPPLPAFWPRREFLGPTIAIGIADHHAASARSSASLVDSLSPGTIGSAVEQIA